MVMTVISVEQTVSLPIIILSNDVTVQRLTPELERKCL